MTADTEIIKGHQVPHLRAWRMSRMLTQVALSELTAHAAEERNARGVPRSPGDDGPYEWKRVPQAQINRIERKGQRVLYTTIDLLADALETTREELLTVDPLAKAPARKAPRAKKATA